MNIFFLDKDPHICAIYHNNKHCVKMIVETAQILSTNYRLLCEVDSEADSILYKKTHENSPSTKWSRLNISNYKWLVDLGLELSKEYTYRYEKIHKTEQIIRYLANNIPYDVLEEGEFTDPPPVMKEEFLIEENNQINSLLSYRNLYMTEKRHFSVWKKRDIPFWFV